MSGEIVSRFWQPGEEYGYAEPPCADRCRTCGDLADDHDDPSSGGGCGVCGDCPGYVAASSSAGGER